MALKVCRVQAKDETLTADPQDLFTMETGIGEALRHPNIVQLFGSEVVPVLKQQADDELERMDDDKPSSVFDPSVMDEVSTSQPTTYMAAWSTFDVLHAPSSRHSLLLCLFELPAASLQSALQADSDGQPKQEKDANTPTTPEKDAKEPQVVMWEARIIQEYCMHGDLRKALKKGRLTGQKVLDDTMSPPGIAVSLALAMDVAAGMSYIHSMKVR